MKKSDTKYKFPEKKIFKLVYKYKDKLNGHDIKAITIAELIKNQFPKIIKDSKSQVFFSDETFPIVTTEYEYRLTFMIANRIFFTITIDHNLNFQTLSFPQKNMSCSPQALNKHGITTIETIRDIKIILNYIKQLKTILRKAKSEYNKAKKENSSVQTTFQNPITEDTIILLKDGRKTTAKQLHDALQFINK